MQEDLRAKVVQLRAQAETARSEKALAEQTLKDATAAKDARITALTA